MPSSRGSSQPRNQTQVSILQADSLPSEPQGEPRNTGAGSLSLLQGILPTQEWNQGLPHCRWILYQLSTRGSPTGSPTTVNKSQEIGIGLVYRPYSDFTSFYMQCFVSLVCVCCSMQLYPMYMLMEPPPK